MRATDGVWTSKIHLAAQVTTRVLYLWWVAKDGWDVWMVFTWAEWNEILRQSSSFLFIFCWQMDLCICQKLAWESVVGSLCSSSESPLCVRMCFYQCCRRHYIDMYIPPWVKVLLYTVYTVDCLWLLDFLLQWMKMLPAEGCVWFRFWSTTSTSLRKIGSHNNLTNFYGTLSSVELKDWV